MTAILADDNFKCIFLNDSVSILIRISLKFIPGSPVNNKPALVQVLAWRWTGRTNADPVHWRICAAIGGDEWTRGAALIDRVI